MLSVPGTTSSRRVSSGHQGRSESVDVDLAALMAALFLFLVVTPIAMPREMAAMHRPMMPSLTYC